MHRQAAALCVAVLSVAAPAAAVAQAFPVKPLRLILPFPPGGPTDLLGRAIAQKLGEQLGQQVVADNRGGAGGNLGLELAAKSAPDGHTIVLSSPLVSISPLLYAKLNYDPAKDLVPISLVAVIQNVMVVHPSVPARNLKELVALARRHPGKMNFGSGGVGTTSHLAPELFKSLTKSDMVHVPYKGTGQALLGMLGGQIDMLVMALAAVAPHVQSGKVRALAVLSDRRHPVLPDVMTSRESGVDNFDVPIWYGILGPTGIPREIVTRLNAELVKAVGSPELKERLATMGVDPRTTTPEQFADFIRSENLRYARVIKDAGIKAE